MTLYSDLLKAGWKMNEIDDMDIGYFLRCRAFEVQRSQKTKKRHIEDVWPD